MPRACHSATLLYIERLFIMALRELRNEVVHVPREEDPGPMDERILSWEDPDFIRVEEENDIPLRGILAGHVTVRYFGASTQLHIVIGQMHHFCELHRENWTDNKKSYLKVEKRFAKSLWNVLYAIKINVTNRHVTKPPIDRNSFDKLVVCYDFHPFHQYWSRRRKTTAERYLNTIKFYYRRHHASQEEMWAQIQAVDDIYCPHL